MCGCDHPSCYTCNGSIYSERKMPCVCGGKDKDCPVCFPAKSEALVNEMLAKHERLAAKGVPTTKPLKAKEALDRIDARFAKGEDFAVIKREELEALLELYHFASDARVYLERSETPFYEGMKKLNAVV